MNVHELALPGLLLLSPKVHRDDRGWFLETFNLRQLTEAGLPSQWPQDNYSFSRKNVLRGIHYQVEQPQGKLIRVTQGAVLDLAVDLRKSSATFGKHVTVELNSESNEMLWIPPGFGHAFLVLSDCAGFAYKVTDYYSPKGERTIVFNDPDLAILWPVPSADLIISDKDRQGKLLREADVFA